MTSRQLRKQRREAERKARKREYQQNRSGAAAAPAPDAWSGLLGCHGGFQAGVDEPAVLRLPKAQEVLAQGTACTEGALEAPVLQHLSAAKTQVDEPAVLSEAKTQVDEPAVLSEAKTQERPGPTGPRTPEGKAISSANSLKHGLASGRLVIPGEDREDFDALLNDLVAEHAPATPTEEMLVQQMAQSWWLMHRALRIQNQVFMETWYDMKKLALFLRYQTTYERAFYRALNSLKKLQKERLASKHVGARHAAPDFVSQNDREPAPEPTRGVGFQPATPAFRPALTGFVSQNGATASAFISPVGARHAAPGLVSPARTL